MKLVLASPVNSRLRSSQFHVGNDLFGKGQGVLFWMNTWSDILACSESNIVNETRSKLLAREKPGIFQSEGAKFYMVFCIRFIFRKKWNCFAKGLLFASVSWCCHIWNRVDAVSAWNLCFRTFFTEIDLFGKSCNRSWRPVSSGAPAWPHSLTGALTPRVPRLGFQIWAD